MGRWIFIGLVQSERTPSWTEEVKIVSCGVISIILSPFTPFTPRHEMTRIHTFTPSDARCSP